MGDIGIVRSLKRKLEIRENNVRTTSTAITFILVFYSECFALYRRSIIISKTTALHGRYKLGNRLNFIYSSCLEIRKAKQSQA